MVISTSDSGTRRRRSQTLLPGSLILLLATAVAGGCESAEPAGRTPGPGLMSAPGRLVDVGGFRLHLFCAGTGRPAVIIETGLGDHMASWMAVQEAAAQRTQVCAYDRAGAGWSENDPEGRTLERMVRRARTALRESGVEGPYVLVGHALGGLLVRRFASEHPELVGGLLLVDSAHENQMRHVPEGMVAAMTTGHARQRFCRIDAPLTLVRAPGLINAYVPVLAPENLRPMHAAAIQDTRYCATARDEARVFAAAAGQPEPPETLGDLPLLVLTAGRGMRVDPDLVASGVPMEALTRWDAAWLDLQADLATLSTSSEHRTIADAGHYVHIDRPDAVVAAIADLAARAQR